jgi:hypothetical protein
MAKWLFGASSSIAKLYHAKFDDVARVTSSRNHIKFSNYLRFRATIKQNEPLSRRAEAVEVRC